MKTILALALAATAFAAAPATSRASDYCYPTYTYSSYCAPTYVCTKEVCRHNECRYATNHCGYTYSYYVVVITYADYYSDGSYKSYNRTYRA